MSVQPPPEGATVTAPRILFYVMYPADPPTNAPRARVQLLAAALRQHARVTVVSGSRFARVGPAWRLVAGGLRAYDAVYVETPTGAAMPWDIAVVAAARLGRKRVGVYFRDAYQLFRDLYPIPGWRIRASDALWRASTAVLRRLASVRYAPSIGLARALRLDPAVLLPPGTDPGSPDLGPGSEPLVAHVGALTQPVGFDRLVEAVGLLRRELPGARLLAVGPAGTAPRRLPDYVEIRQASRQQLPEVLGRVAVCAIPLPINPYTNLAWAFKLADFLSFGKPIVATATDETRRVLDGTGAGIVVGDSPAELAEGIRRVLRDPALAASLAERARALALAPEMSWDARARTVVASLGVEAHR